LHFAAFVGTEAIIKALLSAGAIDKPRPGRVSPAELAAMLGNDVSHHATVQHLLGDR
jgi:hypothetical protein